MRRLISLILVACLLTVAAAQDAPPTEPETTAEPTPEPRPVPTDSIAVDGITLETYFDRLPQGRVGLLRVVGNANVTGARLRWGDALTDFFQAADGSYYGLLVANMDQSPRLYDYSVFVWLADGTRVTLPAQVEVTLGGFIRQDDLTVPPDRAYLVDPIVERNEFARLDSVFEPFTPEKLWDDTGFQFPIASELTSPFGSFRIFNQNFPTRHTGWDLRAATGTPVEAVAAGRVAFAGLLDIRGNHVIIDHGYGVYSGYSHLSQIHVTRGQTITKGQIIGVSGNTGRSGGAHLHWEMTVNGEWVDSVDFMNMWLP